MRMSTKLRRATQVQKPLNRYNQNIINHARGVVGGERGPPPPNPPVSRRVCVRKEEIRGGATA